MSIEVHDYSGLLGTGGAGKIISRPSLLTYGNYSFILMDAPTDATLPFYLAVLRAKHVKTVVRACEATYRTDHLTREGITVISMDFPDGEAPPGDVLEAWRALRLKVFGRFKPDYVDSLASSSSEPDAPHHHNPHVHHHDISAHLNPQGPPHVTPSNGSVALVSPRYPSTTAAPSPRSGLAPQQLVEQKDVQFTSQSGLSSTTLPDGRHLVASGHAAAPGSGPAASHHGLNSTPSHAGSVVAAEQKAGRAGGCHIVPPKHVEIDPSKLLHARHDHHVHHAPAPTAGTSAAGATGASGAGTATTSAATSHPPIIALHCIAGLGRAPLLVAVALIDAGLPADDVIRLIRQRRKGAFNSVQIEFLQSYIPPNQGNCCTIA